MEKDTIITLDDNTEYALLDETIIDGRKFFLSVLLDKTGNPKNEFEIFEEEQDGNDTYMNALEESTLKNNILKGFTSNYLNQLNDINESKD